MTQVEPAAASDEEYTGWDIVVVVLLGLTLLGAGWLDVRSCLVRRSRPPAEFALIEPRKCERVVADELYRSLDSFVLLENIGGLETANGTHFRNAFGPSSTILFSTSHPHARLSVEFYNSVPDQDITIRCNDTVVERFAHQPPGIIEREYSPTLRRGTNNISFAFARYNYGELDLGSPDPRPLSGGVFLKLDLDPD